MELLMITAVQAYEKDIKQLLKKNEVTAFSHMEVTGYKDLSDEPKAPNWFASDVGEHRSALFYAFVPADRVDPILRDVAHFNQDQQARSYVHAAVLDIKQSI